MKTYYTWEDLRNDQIKKRKALDNLSNLQVLQLALGKVVSFAILEIVLLVIGLLILGYCWA